MIPLGSPATGEAEIEAVSDLLATGTLSTGGMVDRFQEAFAGFCGRAQAGAVSSGSVALELALEVSEITAGDGVLVSPFNCGAVLYSLLRQDMVPVFADIDPLTANLDSNDARRAIRDAPVDVTGAILTHLYGLPVAADTVDRLAESHGLTVINDFAQAPGARVRGERVETLGDIGVCSFGPTKNLTTAEGGIVVSDSRSVIETVTALRSNTSSDTAIPQQSVRMNDLEAAIGLAQLEKYPAILERKQSIAARYRERLPGEMLGQHWSDDRTHACHGFPIRHEERDALLEHLASHDIESAPVYDTPLCDYRAYTGQVQEFPHTQAFADEVLLLPIHGQLTDAEVDKVCRAVESFYSSA